MSISTLSTSSAPTPPLPELKYLTSNKYKPSTDELQNCSGFYLNEYDGPREWVRISDMANKVSINVNIIQLFYITMVLTKN